MIPRLGALLLTVIAMVSGTSVISQAQSQGLLTRHVRQAVASGEAKSIGRLPATETMHFDIVLALRHQPELENFLQEIYDPNSPSYRHFVTVKEFTERFGPSQEDYDALIQFAKAHGFTVTGGSRDSMDVQFTASVAAIEKAFHVTMGLYQHPTENRTFYAPDREPTVDLPFRLWHISGLDNYAIPRPLLVHKNLQVKSQAIKGSCPGNSYCGSDMRAAYYGETTLTGAGQTLGLLEYLGYDIADLNTYFKNVNQTNNVSVVGISTDGSSLTCLYPNCDDREQILDMTQSISMAPGMSTLYVFVGSTDTAILSAMSTNTPLSAQLSSSWTWQPGDPSTDDPYFQKFSAQGQNYFQAAGDSGAYNPDSEYVFPADDDYVTSVGGTDLITESAGGPWQSETAWVDGGGGYFTVDNIPIPSWQQLPGVITSQNEGSTTLRNSPDVSAEANFDFYTCADQEACQTGWGGTSFAAPMWAGYMALVNQQAVENGSPTLGFINPTVYELGLGSGYAAAFHDITSGSNGYPAVTGYDLATGWGSPNGAGLINALGGPAGPSFSLTVNPSALSIPQSKSGTSTVTVVPANGFTGTVALTASGLPSGVTATFNPTSTTSSSTLTVTVGSSAAIGTTTITIKGTSGSLTYIAGLKLTVTVNGALVSLTPTSLTFSKTPVGTTSAAKNVTLTNTGTATLSIASITASGNFAVSKTTCGTQVLVGKKCTVSVTFTPTAEGTSTGTLSFNDNAPGNPQTVSLSGTGTSLKLSPTSLSYGPVTVGQTSPAQTVTISNGTTSTVSLTKIGLTGTFPGDYLITNNTCGATLGGNASCTVSIAFKPTARGDRSASLRVTSNGGGSPQTVSLLGTGE
jgi:subtilase family serine protease